MKKLFVLVLLVGSLVHAEPPVTEKKVELSSFGVEFSSKKEDVEAFRKEVGEVSFKVLMSVVTLTNQERSSRGLPTLKVNLKLMKAAAAHAGTISSFNSLSHEAGGSGVGQRLRGQGYDWNMAAENIASGQASTSEAVSGWMSSSGHRTNILRPNAMEIGVAYSMSSSGVYYWCQVFGNRGTLAVDNYVPAAQSVAQQAVSQTPSSEVPAHGMDNQPGRRAILPRRR